MTEITGARTPSLAIFLAAIVTIANGDAVPTFNALNFNIFKLNDAVFNITKDVQQVLYKQLVDNVFKDGDWMNNLKNMVIENDTRPLTFIPESNMTTMELIENMNYKGETHHVTTGDGFKLEIHRILPTNQSSNSDKLPVVLQHGLFGCSSTWVLNYPNQSLGFMLADADYDVWLLNIRGSPYGRSHESLDPHDKQFWDFSFEDVALNDLSSNIDYVLNTTNHTQVHYVGHSMGTTMAFVLLSTKSEYNNKINMAVALAPVAYVHHMKSPLVRLFVHLQTTFKTLLTLFKLYWFPPNDDYSPMADELCPPDGFFCKQLIGELVGFNPKQSNQSRNSVYIHQMFKMTSVRTLSHYGQNFRSKKFRHYDWGFFENLQKYGQLYPPSFALEAIRTPTVFFCGLNDYLSSIEDVELLTQRLPNHVQTIVMEDLQWNHLDFVTSINDGPILNSRIIDWFQMMENYV